MKNPIHQIVIALLLAAGSAAAPAIAEDPVVTGRTAGERSVEPREPEEFEYGQYHRSSKMTPAGSEGPERWGQERTDIGAQEPVSDAAPSKSGTSGTSEFERQGESASGAGEFAREGAADQDEEDDVRGDDEEEREDGVAQIPAQR